MELDNLKVIASFRTHKEKETISGCQDFSCYNKNCFAIADGATQSFYSSIWAELLVNHFCANPEIDPNNWKEWLKPIQEQWLQKIRSQIQKAKTDNNPVWIDNHNRLNRFDSATSTFIGLQFIDNQAELTIVGDSCLFIFQGDKLCETYLFEKSTEFTNRPKYFASYSKNNDYPPDCLDIELGYKKSLENLYFIFATDALAKYIFQNIEKQINIFSDLLDISSPQKFEDFVASARQNKKTKMDNDDVTLMILEVTNYELINVEDSQEKFSPTPLLANITEQPTEIVQSVFSQSDFVSPKETIQNETSDESHSDFVTKIRSVPHTTSQFEKSSMSQSTKKKVPLTVKQRIDAIRNLLFIFIPLNLLLNIITLYLVQQVPKKFSTLEESVNQILSSKSEKNVDQILFSKSSNKSNQTKYVNLTKGSNIYKDQKLQEIIIPNLLNSHEVLILEEGDNWLKFEAVLYVDKSILNKCTDCKESEFEIQTITDLRIFPIQSEKSIFGRLNEPSKFRVQSFPNWYQLKFVGYIKK